MSTASDLEEFANDFTLALLDQAARAAGYSDYADTQRTGLDLSPPPWKAVDVERFRRVLKRYVNRQRGGEI